MPAYYRLCPAKINLHLRVGQRFCEHNRDYHRVLTLLQGVFLLKESSLAGDQLSLSLSEERSVKVSRVSVYAVPEPCAEQDNLVYRAAQLYLEQLRHEQYVDGADPLLWPQHISFELEKYIPEQAGLGGGSSNAAAALLLLNQALPAYMGVKPLAQLQNLAFNLGTDIAFFLQNFSDASTSSLAWGMGRGEKILALKPICQDILHNILGTFELWLIKPQGVHCSTSVMYQLLDRKLERIGRVPSQAAEQEMEFTELERQIEELGSRDAGPSAKIAVLSKLFQNDFFECVSLFRESWAKEVNQSGEEVLGEGKCSAMKEDFLLLASLYDYLYSLAASWVALSGSGSAFFAFFPSELSETEIRKGLELFAAPLEFYPAQIIDADIWASASG